MKKCTYCKENIQDDATICPHCRKQVINPIAVWITIGVFLFIGAIFVMPQMFNGTKQNKQEKTKMSNIPEMPGMSLIKTYSGSIVAGDDNICILNIPEAKDRLAVPTKAVNVYWLSPYSSEWQPLGALNGTPYMMVDYDAGHVSLVGMPVGSSWKIFVFSSKSRK